MRKLFLIIVLLPAILTLGHDVYFFTKNPDRGLMLSDLGWMWDKYHKESHDQWKLQLGAQVDALGSNVQNLQSTVEETLQITGDLVDENITDEYTQSFTQINRMGEETKIIEYRQYVNSNASNDGWKKHIIDFIGFILQQKALFIFGGFTIIIFLIDHRFSNSDKSKSGDLDFMDKRKGKGYKYKKK